MIEYISYYIASIISIFAFLFSYKKIVNNNNKIGIILIVLLLIGSFITTLLASIGFSLIKTIFTLLFFMFIFYIISKKTFKELFYYSLILWIYGLVIDFVNMLIVSVTGLSKYFHMLFVRTGAGIIVSIILVLFCSIPVIKKFTNKTVEKLIKLNPSIIIDSIIILVLIFTSVICFVNINKLSMTLFSIFSGVIIILLIYFILSKNYNIKKLKEVNNILNKNNEFYIKLDTEYRVLKHNLNNQLLGIKSVSNEKTVKLIDDLIQSFNSKFCVPKDINTIPKGINGIIYEKFYTSSNKGLNLAIENSIYSDLLDVLKPKTFNNLCEILGVVVDNAIEASSSGTEKAILIDFAEDKNTININISNTFNSELDIDMLGEKNYSTKGTSRGIGLFSILRKKDIKVKSRIINNLYQTNLIIKKTVQ